MLPKDSSSRLTVDLSNKSFFLICVLTISISDLTQSLLMLFLDCRHTEIRSFMSPLAPLLTEDEQKYVNHNLSCLLNTLLFHHLGLQLF